MMTAREKLIEILSTKIHPREGVDPAAVVADFLLDHDVVLVVRCRDCEYRRDRLYCRKFKPPRIVTGLDFCSYGRRKETQCLGEEN